MKEIHVIVSSVGSMIGAIAMIIGIGSYIEKKKFDEKDASKKLLVFFAGLLILGFSMLLNFIG